MNGRINLLRDSQPETLPTPRRATISTMSMKSTDGGKIPRGESIGMKAFFGMNSKSLGQPVSSSPVNPTLMAGALAMTTVNNGNTSNNDVDCITNNNGKDDDNETEIVSIPTSYSMGNLVLSGNLPSTKNACPSSTPTPTRHTTPTPIPASPPSAPVSNTGNNNTNTGNSPAFGMDNICSSLRSSVQPAIQGETQLTLSQKLGGRHFGELYIYALKWKDMTVDIMFIGDVVRE